MDEVDTVELRLLYCEHSTEDFASAKTRVASLFRGHLHDPRQLLRRVNSFATQDNVGRYNFASIAVPVALPQRIQTAARPVQGRRGQQWTNSLLK